MTTFLTITSKGQITLSKAVMAALGVSVGQKVAVSVIDKKATLKPMGRGILDIAGTLGTFKIPRGKTIDDLIDDAAGEAIEKELR